MITLNELLTRNEEMATATKKFYEGVDEFCKDKSKELNAGYVEFDAVEAKDKDGEKTMRIKGMCYIYEGSAYFYEDDDIYESFYPEWIDPNDLMDILVSLRDTGKKRGR